MNVLEWILIVSLPLAIASPLVLRAPWHRWLFSAAVAALAACGALVYGVRFAMLPACFLAGVLLALRTAALRQKHKKARPLWRGVGVGALSLFYALSCALPLLLPVVDLPEPSGAHPVGTVRLDFVEPDRRNALTGETADCKIAVQVWYPAADTDGEKRAAWMENRQVASLFAAQNGLPDIFGQLCRVRTNSYWNAPPADGEGKYPVVLFSGGSGMFNGQNTVQMEELASHGYAVFAVSHPHEDFATVYADGSVVGASSPLPLGEESARVASGIEGKFSDGDMGEFQRAVIRDSRLNAENIRVWSGDMRFIADQIVRLAEGEIPCILTGKLDTGRLGIFGHSYGGAAAGQVCLEDSRFQAFANLDGTPFGDTADRIVRQPFMVMQAGGGSDTFRPGDGYAKAQKDYLVVSIRGVQHMNFSDWNTIIPNLGKAFGLLGSIDAGRQTEIVNRYLVAFFDQHLKGRRQPLLTAPQSGFSEVTILKK